MRYADKAEELMKSGLNCAQAVCGAFSDLLASEIDQPALLRLASPFGGGFARKRELCGAVSGMGIAFGLLLGTNTPEQRLSTYERSAALADRFIGRYGSVVCRELLEKKPPLETTPREKPWTEEEREKYNWPCIDYVRGAAQILEEYLAEQGVL